MYDRNFGKIYCFCRKECQTLIFITNMLNVDATWIVSLDLKTKNSRNTHWSEMIRFGQQIHFCNFNFCTQKWYILIENTPIHMVMVKKPRFLTFKGQFDLAKVAVTSYLWCMHKSGSFSNHLYVTIFSKNPWFLDWIG